MVLCHGPGGVPCQIRVRERGVLSVQKANRGGLLGSKNFMSICLSTSFAWYCRTIMMATLASTSANRAFTFICKQRSNCAVVA